MAVLNPDNNENNQNNQTGEQKLSDRVYTKGVKPELSPNPKFSGFTKQVIIELKNGIYGHDDIIDALLSDYILLSESAFYDENEVEHPIEPNILFIVKIGNETQYYTVVDPKPQGDETPTENLIRVYPEYPSADAREPGKTPTPALVKGNNQPNLKENQTPRKRPRVFSEPVAFQEEVFIKGREVGNYNHNIYIGDVVIHLVSSKSTPYSYKEFAEMLYRNGCVSNDTALLGSGITINKVGNNGISIYERCGVYSENGSKIRRLYLYSSLTISTSGQQIRTGDNRQVYALSGVSMTVTAESQNSDEPLSDTFKDLVL